MCWTIRLLGGRICLKSQSMRPYDYSAGVSVLSPSRCGHKCIHAHVPGRSVWGVVSARVVPVHGAAGLCGSHDAAGVRGGHVTLPECVAAMTLPECGGHFFFALRIAAHTLCWAHDSVVTCMCPRDGKGTLW